jgi:hypothetical protein
VAKKSDDIDVVALILRWRISRLSSKIANLKSRVAFWEGRGTVRGGGLPMDVAFKLCAWAGRAGEYEDRRAALQVQLAERGQRA